MYWSVIGLFIASEYIFERLISWLPFYWELKTTFLLFLSIPQIQGSTWIYTSYLQPFFAKNEADLDAGIVAAQTNTTAFLKSRFTGLWEVVWSLLSKVPVSAPQPGPAPTPGQASAPGFSLESAKGMWRSYGPAVLSALQPPSRTQPASAPVPPARPAAYATASSTGSFQAAAASSTTSFQGYSTTPSVEHRAPFEASGVPPSQSEIPAGNPLFPEPQHFQ